MKGFGSWKMMWALGLSVGLLADAQTAAHRLVPGTLFQDSAVKPNPPEPGVPTPAQDAPGVVKPWQGGLHIDILQGDRGVNIIKKKTAVTPVVEVRDRNNLPVAGVLVIFSSPTDGPSVTFTNGSRSFSAVSDADGKASATSVKPLNTGDFQLHVSASYQGEVATAVIAMTNILNAGDTASSSTTTTGASSAGLSHTTIGILIGVAAAAAVGVAVGVAGHGGGAASSSSSTVTIGVGSGGTAGAPH